MNAYEIWKIKGMSDEYISRLAVNSGRTLFTKGENLPGKVSLDTFSSPNPTNS